MDMVDIGMGWSDAACLNGLAASGLSILGNVGGASVPEEGVWALFGRGAGGGGSLDDVWTAAGLAVVSFVFWIGPEP